MFFVRKSTYDKVVKEKNSLKLHSLLDTLKIKLLENMLEELQEQVKDYENKLSGLSKEGGSEESKSETLFNMSEGKEKVG